MPMFPVSAFTALILGWLALRTLLRDQRPMLAALLAACALQSLAVTLAVGYDFAMLRSFLPLSAGLIPPLTWVAFRSGLFHRLSLREALPHLAAPLFILFCRFFAPQVIDAVVPLIFAGYGATIIFTLRRSPDLPLARMESGGLPSALWHALGWMLITSALSDVLIALAFRADWPELAGWIISFLASTLLLFIGIISSTKDAQGEAELESTLAVPDAETTTKDKAIIEIVDAFLAREKAHLDPGLTLQRLSRRVRLPEKRVSAAINRTTGENVSRYINDWRIRHACDLIRAGTNITEAMLASGFNTKSNFNREFLRVMEASPSGWMAKSSA